MRSADVSTVAGWLIGVAMGAIATYLWLTTSAKHQNVEPTSASAAPTSAARQTNSSSDRRRHSGSAGKPWKQVVFSKAELEANPKFWMLGYSEQDIGWLNQFGYPTLEEEAQLSAATANELSDLARVGNLNAKVHLGVRLAQRAVVSGNVKEFGMAARLIEQSLIEGGPYQAAKTVDSFVELSKQGRSISGLPNDQRNEFQKELLPLLELAKGISAMYGDYAAIRALNANRNIESSFGLPMATPLQFEFAMSRFANMNKERVRRGLAPYDIVPRPSPPGPPDILSFQETNTLFVR
jgi:hypothetical protein